ncbi:MAG: hypothetical protein OHK0046_10300 [Anaerolineae bacterium]
MDFLASLDPNVLYLALIFSLWVGVSAAYIPGTGVMEGVAVVGLVGCLLALSQQPTNWLAVLVVVVGVCSFILMPFIRQQFAVLAVGGLGLQAAGGLFLFRGGLAVSPFVIALTVIVPFAYHQWVLLPILNNMTRLPVVDKDDLLVGMVGRVTKDLNPIGTVNVNSELWTAVTEDEKRIKSGEAVMVVARNGLQLTVEKVKQKNAD